MITISETKYCRSGDVYIAYRWQVDHFEIATFRHGAKDSEPMGV
jgi:hypothetical protein